MEIILEILGGLGELFLEDGVEYAADRKLPKWQRALILIGAALTFTAVFAVILAVGIKNLRESPLLSVLMFALAAGLVVLCFCKVRKVLQKRPHQ